MFWFCLSFACKRDERFPAKDSERPFCGRSRCAMAGTSVPFRFEMSVWGRAWTEAISLR